MNVFEKMLHDVADAIRKLAVASSECYGVDCYLHAALAKELLRVKNIDSRIVVGFAAWRVGEGDGDVITHRPQKGAVMAPGSAPYHVWLELNVENGIYIFDITTYQIPDKARALDEMDGGNTTVSWAPPYIWVPRTSTATFHDVAQGGTGLYYYEENAELQPIIVSCATPIDPVYLETLDLIMKNSDLKVIGFNHFQTDVQARVG